GLDSVPQACVSDLQRLSFLCSSTVLIGLMVSTSVTNSRFASFLAPGVFKTPATFEIWCVGLRSGFVAEVLVCRLVEFGVGVDVEVVFFLPALWCSTRAISDLENIVQ